MKQITNLTLALMLLFLSSCAELEKAGERAAAQTVNNLADRTVRKVQNKIETKAEKTIDNTIDGFGKAKPYKRMSETDSLETAKNKTHK